MRKILIYCSWLFLAVPFLFQMGCSNAAAHATQLRWIPGTEVVIDSKSCVPVAKERGTLLPTAVMATIPRPGGKIFVALDADSPKARTPNLIRLDFTGTGQFGAQYIAKFDAPTKSQGGTHWEIQPATFTVKLDGQVATFTVAGWYRKQRAASTLGLRISRFVQADCVFGTTRHAVRIIDGNGNDALGDPFTGLGGTLTPTKFPDALKTADILLIDLADGQFTTVAETCYGQPVYVDGAWYLVSLTAGSTVSARPFEGKMATLKTDMLARRGLLVGRTHLLNLSGLAEEQVVPADHYLWFQLEEQAAGDARQAPRASVGKGVAKVFDLTAAATTRLEIESLGSAHVRVLQQGGQYFFSLQFSGILGGDVPPAKALDRLPETVPFEIVDARGRILFRSTFEPG